MSENELNEYTQKIAELNEQIAFLEKENTRLSETVEWMHKLIWDLYKRLRIPVS